MATREQVYTAKILINSQEAENKLKKMEQQMVTLRQRRDQALNEGKMDVYKAANKEMERLNKNIEKQKLLSDGLNRTLGNMSTAKQKELETVIKAINRQLNSGAVERNSKEWKALNATLQETKSELRKIKAEGTEQMSLWQRFNRFMNDSWGSITVMAASVTGLSMTIRKVVQDFADMEEAMADTRKYTGLADEGVRDLNEDLKKMDTRTSREELNELAGAAGRLGITAKQSILEFVEAGDMIKVALGDDLGDGAIDRVGKLAMAFGEDDKMGLRGAMLATGSAINELAQNSSAQAGYLVDFTARVAGFAKQIGLTQAQIMGFGTVMDENLLQDEMSATAFGNMLTKMQTDTEKFAKIAGMDIKEFSDLLRKDANGAVLALADSLNSVDPQQMMKMLTDMGLDGARAVGVLATMASKIDDVRRYQELATNAYKEGISVQNEFNTMNNTVQAGIDKAKKRFHEVSVELGERLEPIVKYTISSTSMLVKVLSTLTGFVFDNAKALTILAANIAVLTAMWKADVIAMKAVDARNKIVTVSTTALHASTNLLRMAGVALQATWALLTKGMRGYVVVMRAAKMASLTNPWTALATVLSVVGVVIYGMVKGWQAYLEAVRQNDPAYRAARAHAKDMADVAKKANESISKEAATIQRLTNIIRSNAFTVDERRKAISRLQQIVPGYHASITDEGKLYEKNADKVKEYIRQLQKAARTQAYMDKLTELEGESLDADTTLHRKQYNLKAVDAELNRGKGSTYKSNKTTRYDPLTRTYHEVELNDKLNEKLAERKHQEEAVNKALSDRDQIERRRQMLYRQMQKEGIGMPEAETTTTGGTTTKTTKTYVSDSEQKKKEAEQNKADAERKKHLKEQADAAKASYQMQLAAEMEAYMRGAMTYEEFLGKRYQLTQQYYDKLKGVYGEDSNEYRSLMDNRMREEQKYNSERAKVSLDQLTYEHMEKERAIRRKYMAQEQQDGMALDEALLQNDIDYMRKKQQLYIKDPKKWAEMEMEIKQTQDDAKFRKEQMYMQRLQQFREETGRASMEKLQKMELQASESFYRIMVEQGHMTEEEFTAIIEQIKRKFKQMEGEITASQSIKSKAREALETAKKLAGTDEEDADAGDNAATGIYAISSAIARQKMINKKLKELYGEDYANNKEYQEAKRQLDAETMQQVVAGAQAAYSTINTLLSAASSYAQACSDLEVAKITANYDKQIEAAGKNNKKREKLEKEKEKAIAKAKTEANEKAMGMEMAQAVASTALAAINAYASASKVAWWLGPVAAALAVAAGGIQIATIKKQHEAEAAGYYEGGFTGGNRYKKEAGVVHEGEFVANHKAVQNPSLMPVLSLIDRAQRDNRVGSLTSQDVTNAMGGPASTVLAPVINVQQDNTELSGALEKMNETTDRLATQLEQGIGVDIPIDGENGMYKKMKTYENLIKTK